MAWSSQQVRALKAVRQWLQTPSAPQIFRLFGYAGTGKTTVAQEIAGQVSGLVVAGAFTGKAALQLRSKGLLDATTIHSMIYRVEEDDAGQIHFKWNPDAAIADAQLVLIDEVSMVDEALALDLLRYGVRVLVLGDPAQLPPVNGTGYFINATPDVMLTEIHRQAADNPIIRMSMEVRKGRRLQLGRYGDSRVITRREIEPGSVTDADQVLVGMNKTRRAFNARIRQLREHITDIADWQPVAGDRLVCLKNNKDKGLMNGSLWDIDEITHRNRSVVECMVSSADGMSGDPRTICVPVEFFQGREKELDRRALRDADQFDYGEALTVHKSQGSQWDDVMLFDESGCFREHRMNHLYTGITRAAERLTVVV